MKSLLVVSEAPDVFRTIRDCFSGEDEVARASSREDALTMLTTKRYEFVFIDLELLGESVSRMRYKEVLQQFWHLYPSIEVIVLCPSQSIREAVMAVKAGASNYLTRPVDPDEIQYVTESVSELALIQSELEYLREESWEPDLVDIVRTKNTSMKEVFDKIRSVAPTKSTVLLIGETGTGKGILAKLIHRRSKRRDEPFIHVHCGAIPDTLVESELFGHEKGAFTGAVRRKLGKFEIAKGGTIFLDEIGTITPSAQIKLLQIIQDGIFQRVGGEETIQADARIIAASNMDLKQMSEEGAFRQDLFYRLHVFPIELPPLRARKEDIEILVDTFLQKLNRFHDKEIEAVDPIVMAAFNDYSWPGNIRELENLLERAYILEDSSMLTPASFPSEIFPEEPPAEVTDVNTSQTLAEARRVATDQFEMAYLTKALAENKGRMNTTARAAGISTRQLHKLMKKHGIRKEDYRSSHADSECP
jgi:DNA-binding NtrC family response regulator